MKALCRIGLHSWEVVQAISGREISEGLFESEIAEIVKLLDPQAQGIVKEMAERMVK
jgi:hypothetical protein